MAYPTTRHFFICKPLAVSIHQLSNCRATRCDASSHLKSFIRYILPVFSFIAAAGLAIINIALFRQLRLRIKHIENWVIISSIGFFLYLFMAAYDHLTVIAGGADTSAKEIITFNNHIPYSIALFVFTLIVLVVSFIKNLKPLRLVSMVFLVMTILKVFIFDFNILDTTSQALVFWFIGGYLFLYSFVYQQLRRKHLKAKALESRKKKVVSQLKKMMREKIYYS